MNLGPEGLNAFLGSASRGLGAAIAGVLAAEKAKVAIGARKASALASIAGEIGATPVQADLANAASVERAVRDAHSTLGGLDPVVVDIGDLSGYGRTARRGEWRRWSASPGPRGLRQDACVGVGRGDSLIPLVRDRLPASWNLDRPDAEPALQYVRLRAKPRST